MKRVYMNITAYVMAVIIILTSILSLPLSVSAQTTATDDNGNNVIKLLDMALNQSGISASPTTIQDFLDYMFGTVTEAGQVLSDTFTGAYNSVSDYVSACKEKVADTASNIPAPAKSLINGYLDYIGKSFDVVENAKTGYAQGKNFRNYLMSYVTDINDNQINGAISNNNKYHIKGELVNLVRQNMDEYIKEYEGYWIIPTLTYKDMTVFSFSDKDQYEKSVALLKTLPDDFFCIFSGGSKQFFAPTDDLVVVGNLSSDGSFFNVDFYKNDWTKNSIAALYLSSLDDEDLSACFLSGNYFYKSGLLKTTFNFNSNGFIKEWIVLFTTDGRSVKIWKSLDAFKVSSVGKSNIYYSNTYSSFDNSVDNSVTFSGDYYMNNDYSHTTIQNNIDNSQEINETTVNNIVNNYITNNYYGSDDGSGGGGSGGGSGNWFTDLITGIPQLLSALLDGIAGLLEAGGRLLEVVTDLFVKLFVPSEGFADPLIDKVNEKFTFKEQSRENIDLIFDQLPDMGQTIPTITFPFSKTSLAKYGVEDITVSFDWYAPYKPTVDMIFSAILWVMFAFNQYFAVKNIINASGSAVDIATRL